MCRPLCWRKCHSTLSWQRPSQTESRGKRPSADLTGGVSKHGRTTQERILYCSGGRCARPDRVCGLAERSGRAQAACRRRGRARAAAKIDPKEVAQPAESSQDTSSPTTVKEYRFKPAEKLPPVKGTAAYKPLEKNTVRFALNVWAGWAPIVLANNGFKAGQEWTGR